MTVALRWRDAALMGVPSTYCDRVLVALAAQMMMGDCPREDQLEAHIENYSAGLRAPLSYSFGGVWGVHADLTGRQRGGADDAKPPVLIVSRG